MQKFLTNVVIKRTSCTDLAVLHSYHIFSKDQLWCDSETEPEGAARLHTSTSAPPSFPTTANKKPPATQMQGGWGCVFSVSWVYIGDSNIPPISPPPKKKTCIRIQMEHSSLRGRTERGQAPSDPYRGIPAATKASQESLLKIYIYLWTRFLYLLRFNLSINCTNVTAVGHWTLSSGCQSRP